MVPCGDSPDRPRYVAGCVPEPGCNFKAQMINRIVRNVVGDLTPKRQPTRMPTFIVEGLESRQLFAGGLIATGVVPWLNAHSVGSTPTPTTPTPTTPTPTTPTPTTPTPTTPTP